MLLIKFIKRSIFFKVVTITILLSLLPIILLGIYSSIKVKDLSQYLTTEQINSITTKVLQQKSIFLEKEAELIDGTFIQVEQHIELIQKQAENLFTHPPATQADIPDIHLIKSPYGYLWEPFNEHPFEKSNTFVSSISSTSSKVVQDLQIAKQLDPLLQQTYKNLPILKGVFFLLAESAFIIYPAMDVDSEVKSGELPPDLEVDDYDFFYLANELYNPDRKVIWTNVYYDVTQWGEVVTAIIPIYLQDDKMMGVIGADLPVAALTSQFLDFKFEEANAFTFITDSRGNFIAGEQDKYLKAYPTSIDSQILAKMKGHSRGFQLIETESLGEVYHLFEPIDSNGWFLNLLIPKSDITAPIIQDSENKTAQLLKQFFIDYSSLLFICVILLLVLSYYFSKTVTNPIHRLIEALRESKLGNYGKQIPVFSTDEIGNLTQTFNEMSATIGELVEDLNEKAHVLEERVLERTNMLQKTNHELIKTYRKLKITEESRSELLLQISHDLKTPLTKVKGYIQLLKRYNFSSEERHELIESVLMQTNHIIELINDLFDLSSLEIHELEFEKEWIEIEFIVEHAVAMLKKENHKSNVDIHVSYDDDLPLVFIDPRRFNRVLINLIENAIKYSKLEETIRVHIIVTKEENQLIILVKDHGIGIAPEHIDKITELFYREPRAKDANITGSGIGINIAKKIIEGHHGKLDISSTLNAGTVVKILLPIDMSDE